MPFLANFGNFGNVCSGLEMVRGSNWGVRGLHDAWLEVFLVGNGCCKKIFLVEPICLNSVDQAQFARSQTIDDIQPKLLSFVRTCHIDSPIHISRDLVG